MACIAGAMVFWVRISEESAYHGSFKVHVFCIGEGSWGTTEAYPFRCECTIGTPMGVPKRLCVCRTGGDMCVPGAGVASDELRGPRAGYEVNQRTDPDGPHMCTHFDANARLGHPWVSLEGCVFVGPQVLCVTVTMVLFGRGPRPVSSAPWLPCRFPNHGTGLP